MLIADLPTPALLVDRVRLEANLAAMQARAAEEGVALRPHAKTHKSAEVARRQVAGGAEGLTVATIAEAEAFAAAGFSDVLLASPVAGRDRLARAAALVGQGVRLAFTVDTRAGAEAASAVFAAHGLVAEVRLEVDTGHARNGLRHDDPEAPALARHIAGLPGLRMAGVLTHGGHVYAGPREGEAPAEALERVAAEERDRLLRLAARLGEAGVLRPGEASVSLGSTPTLSVFRNRTGGGFRVTEVRPGNYVFHDAQQVALGAASLRQCALTLVATVLSRQRAADGTERLVIDAGKKALGMDTGWGVRGFGTLLYSRRTMRPAPHGRLVRLSEEHGVVEVPGGAVQRVGDPVMLVPNHACVAVALHRRLHLAEGDEVTETWDVLAR
ncbi:MAG: alanine racemase [Rubricoccaceae bacterium]